MDKFAESESHGGCCNAEEYVAVQSGIDAVNNADVFVVATANDILELPFFLRRAGRFDHVMRIEMPNRREAVEIVRHYLKDKKVSKDFTPELVARLMDGKSCSALESRSE